MTEILKWVVKILGFAFAALVIGFTGLQSYNLIFEVTGSHIQAALGLVLFDIGAFYWFLVLFKEAESIMQFAIAALMFGASLATVILTVALELGAAPADILGENTPAILITLAAVLNLVAKYLFPLVSTENLREINGRIRAAKLETKTDKKLDQKMDAIAEDLADEKAEHLKEKERIRIRTPLLLEAKGNPALKNTAPAAGVELIPLAEPSRNGSHAD